MKYLEHKMESININIMRYDFSDTFNKVNRNLNAKIDSKSMAEILRFERDMAWYFEDLNNLAV